MTEPIVERVLQQVRDELGEHADVFEDPRAYWAGVQDACDSVARHASRLPDAREHMQALRHEMATPLVVIASVTETLLERWHALEGDTVRTFLEMARRNATLLSVLLDHLPTGDELEGTFEVDPERVELRGLLKQTISDLGAVTHGRPVELLTPGRDIEATVDPEAFRRILYALVSNAHKYSPPGWPIAIRLSQRDGDAVIRIVDGGPGVPAGQRDAVFERHYRLHRDTSGLGLGLYLARGLARAHGGDLTLHAGPGGAGATFLLRLPTQDLRSRRTGRFVSGQTRARAGGS